MGAAIIATVMTGRPGMVALERRVEAQCSVQKQRHGKMTTQLTHALNIGFRNDDLSFDKMLIDSSIENGLG